MEKDEILLCLSEKEMSFDELLAKTLSKNKLIKNIKLLLSKRLIDEEDKLSLPKVYDEEQFFNYILLNLNCDIERKVLVSNEVKKNVAQKLLVHQETQKPKKVKQHISKNSEWVYILNALRKIKSKHQDVQELEIIESLKKEFEQKFVSYFK